MKTFTIRKIMKTDKYQTFQLRVRKCENGVKKLGFAITGIIKMQVHHQFDVDIVPPACNFRLRHRFFFLQIL